MCYLLLALARGGAPYVLTTFPSPTMSTSTLAGRRTVLFVLLSWFVFSSTLHAAKLPRTPASLTEDGVRFERVGEKTFRWMAVIKVYDAALHLAPGESTQRIFADMPTRLQLSYHRGFKATEIIQGGDTLLARNVDAAALEALRPRLQTLNAVYRDVKPGDSYTLTYVPGRGTTLRLNGEPLITIPGHDFAAAYFRIWLGDDPISPSLRDTLLGR